MTASRAGVLAALILLVGCAGRPARLRRHALPPPARESRADAPRRSVGPAPGLPRRDDDRLSPPVKPEVAAAIETATSMVGHRAVVVEGVDYGPGCGALVRAAFARTEHPLPAEVRDAEGIHALASARGALAAPRTPAPGDLVFLADHPGGPPAHVGLVAHTEADGTALVIHRVARGVMRVRMNLAYPERPTDPSTGKHINDVLVVHHEAMPAGSLVVAVSDLLRRG